MWGSLGLVVVCSVAVAAGVALPLSTVTFASDQRAFFLEQSLSALHYDPRTTLPPSTPLARLAVLRSHVLTLPLDDVVLVVFAPLAVAVGSTHELLGRFLNANADVVFAARATGDGHSDGAATSTRFRFLSGGALMGRVAALRTLLDRSVEGFASEEAFFRDAMLSVRGRFVLDSGKVLFCDLADFESDDDRQLVLDGRRFLVRETQTYPGLLFAGPTGGAHCYFRTVRRLVVPRVSVVNAQIYPLALRRGETLFFQATVRNANEFDLQPQAPEPAWVYDSRRSFVADGFQSETAAFRLGVDWAERTRDDEESVDHPYRWGMGERISSGLEKTVVLGVRMNTCFAGKREYSLDYVFENFFWQINLAKANVTVKC